MIQVERNWQLNSWFGAVFALLIAFTFQPSTALSAVHSCKAVFSRQVPREHIRTYEASANLSQYIRDNAPDFWMWSRVNNKRYFNNLISHQGLVIGDSHPGNFIYSALGGRMRFFIMDIKDAGHGPFISDIAHQIMATNSIFKRGEENLTKSTQRQLDAYVRGLRGGRFQPHERLSEIFETRLRKFEREVDEYVEDKTKDNRFKFKEEMIEPLSQHVESVQAQANLQRSIRANIERFLPGAEVLDFAYRPRERGGSKNLKRYWALIVHDGRKQILEFKEIEDPAVAQYGPQLPHAERFERVMQEFWQVNDPYYQVADIGGQAYWMRPKKIDVFTVPYQQNSKSERKFLRHLAAYEAYLMGKYHGRQLQTQEYAEQLKNNQTTAVEQINRMAHDYTERLKERVERLQEREDYD